MKKLSSFFSSCKIAFDSLQKQTGLIFLHLNHTENTLPRLTLFDAIGAVHKLSLDRLSFALQKKATLAYPTISHLLEAGELDAAKKRISSLLRLMALRTKLGIKDHDARKRNFGFVGSEAVEIDLGSFSYDAKLKNEKTGKRTFLLEASRFRIWVEKYHKELLEHLDEEIKNHLFSSFQTPIIT